MRKSMLRALPLAIGALLLGSTASAGWYYGPGGWWYYERELPEIEFADADLFFELNNTDGDLGIHALIDGEPWKRLEIEDPYERRILNIRLSGRLRRQGLTELAFESAEPTFDELTPQQFFRRFPEGEYEIEGLTLDYRELESVATVSHVMPAPPDIYVSGLAVSEDCETDPGPPVSDPITVSWPAVEESHPDLGKEGEIEVDFYELVLEQEQDEGDVKFAVELPPSVTEVTLPGGVLVSGDVKVEVLVKSTEEFGGGNRTATESCFEVNGP